MQTQSVVSLSDLRKVSIGCRQCSTQILLDLEERLPRNKILGDTKNSAECPGCGTEYDDATRAGLLLLWDAFRALSPVAALITFRAADAGAAK